jgi:ubiquinone/menaquinone biosynthesis C-methylase UbiE
MQTDPQGTETRALLNAAEFAKARVLEIGCGEGRLIFRYASATALIAGIEPDAAPLSVAAGSCPSEFRPLVTFVQATAPLLPFRDAAFDIVLFAKSL